jgi:uncharacterized protein YjbI with pentapeptide repeats
MTESTQQEPTMPPKRSRSSRSPVRPGTQHTRPQEVALLRPDFDDLEGWSAYWTAQGQPWRTEPEIDSDRQQFLEARRAMLPDIKQGIYPFKDIPLSRADVEWLLVTHEQGAGPIIWNDPRQRERVGLDLRGADLRRVNLRRLPLARLYGGLRWVEWEQTTDEQHDLAGIHLEGANLNGTLLHEARLRGAHLEGANLRDAWLEGAFLYQAHLEGATLFHVNMERANLMGAHLEGKGYAGDEQAVPIVLPAADLRLAFFNVATSLEGVHLGNRRSGFVSVDNVHWGGVNLSVVDWTSVDMLGDECTARQKTTADGRAKTRGERLRDHVTAVRANRQVAVALREQGINEEADRFAYRAQVLQRAVLRRQRKFLKYLGSWLLWLIAGYGYRPLRTILIYLCVIAIFAAAYLTVTHTLPTQTAPLAWYEALVLSISSFHGRGFFQPVHSLGDPVAILASVEAIFGLLIEVSFIATFTQRFFGR